MALIGEFHPHFDTGVVEHIVTIDPNDPGAFDTSTGTFVLGQVFGPGKIQFQALALADRGLYRQQHQGPHAGDVDTTAIEKPRCLRMPDTNRPTDLRSF